MKSSTLYKACCTLLLLCIVDCGSALMLSLLADLCFIIWPERFYLPVVLFSLSHALYMEIFLDLESDTITRFALSLQLMLVVFDRRHLIMNYAAMIGTCLLATGFAYLMEGRQSRKGLLFFLGYLLFGLSDLLLYIRDFKTRFPLDDYLVLTLYYVAQVLLNRGVIDPP